MPQSNRSGFPLRLHARALAVAASFLLSPGAHAHSTAGTLDPIARDESGNVRLDLNTQTEAQEYCHRHGSRLPTIRELAFALSPGIVSETQDGTLDKVVPKGEAPLYFNSDNPLSLNPFREAPEGSWYWIWSSSVSPRGSAYGVDEWTGFPAEKYGTYYQTAVRCLKVGHKMPAF